MKKETSSKSLRMKRKKILSQLPPLEDLLRGSLIKRTNPPGKKGQEPPGKFYLSVSNPQSRPQLEYIPKNYQPQVTQYLENYQQLKKDLQEICAINNELLKRREKL